MVPTLENLMIYVKMGVGGKLILIECPGHDIDLTGPLSTAAVLPKPQGTSKL